MKKNYLTTKNMIGALCALLIVSTSFQLYKGWDTKDFLERTLITALGFVLAWRARALIGSGYPLDAQKARYRFALHSLFWVAVAVALFIGFQAVG